MITLPQLQRLARKNDSGWKVPDTEPSQLYHLPKKRRDLGIVIEYYFVEILLAFNPRGVEFLQYGLLFVFNPAWIEYCLD